MLIIPKLSMMKLFSSLCFIKPVLKIVIVNSGGTLTNSGTFTNDVLVENHGTAVNTLDGVFDNSGTFLTKMTLLSDPIAYLKEDNQNC